MKLLPWSNFSGKNKQDAEVWKTFLVFFTAKLSAGGFFKKCNVIDYSIFSFPFQKMGQKTFWIRINIFMIGTYHELDILDYWFWLQSKPK